MEVRISCEACDGTGVNPSPVVRYDGEGNELPSNTVCSVCGGVGYFVNAVATEEVGVKLDAIIAEQASVRTDLTAALTAIWNKVKDL